MGEKQSLFLFKQKKDKERSTVSNTEKEKQKNEIPFVCHRLLVEPKEEGKWRGEGREEDELEAFSLCSKGGEIRVT